VAPNGEDLGSNRIADRIRDQDRDRGFELGCGRRQGLDLLA
jgi:hypothetical protein